MWLLILAAILTSLLYKIVIKPLGYWKKRNVPYRKPWPILGNMAPFAFGKKSSHEMFKCLYNEFPDKRYIGTYLFVKPALLIRDPELIKQLTVKDFNCFADRALFRAIEEVDPILSKSFLMLQGEKWKGLRATLTPCFTANKMKFMFTLFSDCAKDFTKFFEKQGPGVIKMETIDTFSRFVVGAIGTCVFGIKFFGIPAIPQKYSSYLSHVFQDVIHTRKSTGLIRPDMIHIFLERRKIELLLNKTENAKDLSDESLIAQAMTFFLAGFDNTTNIMSFLGYELALNPNIQKRLQKEIDATLEEYHGKITYDALFAMKYMDMVVLETLRLWPTGPVFDRMCLEDYVIAPKLPNEEPLLVEKGTTLLFALGPIQHDPKYFPNPLKFDPERFNDENKSKITPFSNISFGAGPRNCIAKRFAIMAIKIVFFHLLSKFDVVTTEKTKVPVIQSKLKLNMGPEGGMWLGFRQRKLEE